MVVLDISRPVIIPDRFADYLMKRSASATHNESVYRNGWYASAPNPGFSLKFENSNLGRRSDVKEGSGDRHHDTCHPAYQAFEFHTS